MHPQDVRACQPKRHEDKRERDRQRQRDSSPEGEREKERQRKRPLAHWLLFLYVFSYPWTCPM